MQQQQATADGQVLQQTEYLYEPGSFRPMAQVTHHNQGSELHYIVTDHAGTPQELCNEQGDIVWRGEQALWGHYHGQSQRHWQRREEAANDSIQCDLRYQGQIEDSESGLYYNVNRYYDADSGQYLSPDPIGFAGGLRPQAYVVNPLEWVDPLGLAGAAHGSESEDVAKGTPSGGSPALIGDPYHPDIVATRQRDWQKAYGGFDPKAAAADLGYAQRIPPQKAPFNSHGQPVFSNGKSYISPDVDGHNVTNGWKMFDRKGRRTGTWNSDLSKRLKD
ncbi:RHS repeat-associated core domain-containing protein [Salinivibrio sp. MA427]|uniref:RHS repeat-associated core domain-containing protein n=1 Tax=Salinivibrio sp. MA427 TaxID=1909455 RepID=UPI001F5BACCA|nr:RHS repeat-associated core domain-containing protein [Salinivibrio sp. MA427]